MSDILILMTKETKKSILKLILVTLIVVAICVGAYFLLKLLGLDNLETLRKVCNNNIWGALIFIVLQIFQVVFLPIGNLAFTIPGAIIFGATKGFFITWFGVAVGSVIMYYVGRYGGGKLLDWIVGKEKGEHYKNIIKQGKYLLPALLLIPIFPDDIVCASAGMAKVNAVYFWILIFITRGIDTFCTCFIAVEAVKSPAGIAVLVLFCLIMAIVAFFLTKYRNKIDEFFVKTFTRKKCKQKQIFINKEPINVYSTEYIKTTLTNKDLLSIKKAKLL